MKSDGTKIDELEAQLNAGNLRLALLLGAIGDLQDDPEAFRTATGSAPPRMTTVATVAALTPQQVEISKGT